MRIRSSIRHALFLAAVLLPSVPAAAHLVHVRLEIATPAPDAVLTAAPNELRLRFSGRIEERYTQVALTGPDGRGVPLGSVVFVEGSDREFHAMVPPLTGAGAYTVHWRTAGADGHVLQGSYAFRLAPVAAPDPDTATAAAADPDEHDPAHGPALSDEQHAHDVVHTATRPLNVAGRAAHFGALILLLGGITFRILLLPRVPLEAGTTTLLRRRVWRATTWAALLLVGAAVLRLWLQSVELHGADRAWSTPLLSLMLTGTSWGQAWVVQAVLLGALAAALVAVRPNGDRLALMLAVPATAALAAIPALSGHAVGAAGVAPLVVLNDAAHVIAAGAWLGTLAIIMIVALPALGGHGADGRGDVALLIARFSPLALAAAAVLVGSGIINALLHFPDIAQVTGTPYGRTLLLKVGFVACIAAAGAWNWRVIRPRLERTGDGTDTVSRLRVAIAFELAFAGAVLIVTAVLTGVPRP